jgi:hypothetical protein
MVLLKYVSTVVGANLCAWRLLEVLRKLIRGVGGVCSIHFRNITSQRQYLATPRLSCYIGNVFCLHSTFVRLPSTCMLVAKAKRTFFSLTASFNFSSDKIVCNLHPYLHALLSEEVTGRGIPRPPWLPWYIN